MPVGGETGWVGGFVRVVSRESCARTVELTPTTASNTLRVSAKNDPRCTVGCAELVVCVSLTHERTVYFTL